MTDLEKRIAEVMESIYLHQKYRFDCDNFPSYPESVALLVRDCKEIIQALRRQLAERDRVIGELKEVLELAQDCIVIHSERLGESLREEGNVEPQFACEATRTIDLIEKLLTQTEQK